MKLLSEREIIELLSNKIEQLEAEHDDLKADALRYRWLRNNKYTAKYPNSEFDYSMHLNFTVSGVWSDAADSAVLDAQIDAAIRAMKEPE